MDDFWSVAFVTGIALMIGFGLGLSEGSKHAEGKISASCVDFGKVKIGKMYECKPIGN